MPTGNPELLACPFCGGPPESNSMFAWCRGPGERRHIAVQLPHCDWNTRATPPPPASRATLIKGLNQAVFWLRSGAGPESVAAVKAVEQAITELAGPALPEEREKLVERLYDTMLWGIGGNRANKADDMKAAIREALALSAASLPDEEAVDRDVVEAVRMAHRRAHVADEEAVERSNADTPQMHAAWAEYQPEGHHPSTRLRHAFMSGYLASISSPDGLTYQIALPIATQLRECPPPAVIHERPEVAYGQGALDLLNALFITHRPEPPTDGLREAVLVAERYYGLSLALTGALNDARRALLRGGDPQEAVAAIDAALRAWRFEIRREMMKDDPRCIKCDKPRSVHNFFGGWGYLCHNGLNTFLSEYDVELAASPYPPEE